MTKRRIIALLTDFGLEDGYVGVMKGIIGDIAPDTNVIDISHQIFPQNIDQAAYLLWSAYRYFPPETIFVCVVDPGVGSSRNILCAQIARYYFLVPDNGVLKFILGDAALRHCVRVSNSRFMSEDASDTFHGRDIFAPAAAHLARGVDLKQLGPVTSPDSHAENFIDLHDGHNTKITARVIHIDHFGNLITNIKIPKNRKPLMIARVKSRSISTFARCYEEAGPKRPFMTRGSNGLLEIAIKNGNAAGSLRVRIGERIHVGLLK